MPAATPAPQRKPLQVEPVRAAEAGQVNGQAYDLIVIGGTPGGIACAVRAAREGLSVLIVQHNRHIGGMITNGLMQWDALYAGHRAPIFNEVAGMIGDYYLKTYGEDSPQYKTARFTQTHYPMSLFESSVAEHLFNKLVSAEKNITTLLSHYPVDSSRDAAILTGLTLRKYGTSEDIQVKGKVFADATYEGDLAALVKVPYRIGREGRDEYGEPHAGKVFTNISSEKGPKEALDGTLNIHPYGHVQGTIDPNSPFTADGAVQAYNYRFCLTKEEGNRLLPEKPPGYNREEFVNYYRKGLGGGRLNGKGTFNNPILPGENHAYPDASWPEREKIIERHKNFALGLMYFLQNDESLSEAKRAGYRQSGLPLDEYPDNGHIPYEMYVREGRRIVGRYVFKEQDNRLAAAYGRSPVMTDSIAITDWSMDSHDCTWDRSPGYAYDGKLILTEESRPAQIPWRSLLPQGVDNLIVPVCLSATHVAWGAVRLEPVWMQLGESAGFAAALSVKKNQAPAFLDPALLIQSLVKNRMMITFLNDVDVASNDPQVMAAQYFGSKGFFSDYNAGLDLPLSTHLKTVWQGGFDQLQNGTLDVEKLAIAVHQASAETSEDTGMKRGEFLVQLWSKLTQP
ncbi:FAD-dependent oxidoreductase [Prosthecobacter fusiformis]|uniref:FAD-dependent oxidoreductase n=1 Tax=Prosthecobacter fusiformis TaxID=48464 RepID=UPI001414CD60|nr:FAD-dependent oxidoreductase [Prosthecobacter fusiformis]